MMNFVYDLIVEYEYLALFSLLMLGIVGLPVPDETLLVFCGYLISTGKFSWAPTLLCAISGSLSGITISFGLGRIVGLPTIRRFSPRLHLSQELLERTKSRYFRYGKFFLFFGYFFPGIRHVVAIIAGSTRLPYSVFAFFAYLGGVIWVSLFISLGYVVEEEWIRLSTQIHRYTWIASGTIVVLGTLGYLVFRTRGKGDHRRHGL